MVFYRKTNPASLKTVPPVSGEGIASRLSPDTVHATFCKHLIINPLE